MIEFSGKTGFPNIRDCILPTRYTWDEPKESEYLLDDARKLVLVNRRGKLNAIRLFNGRWPIKDFPYPLSHHLS